MKYGLQLYSVRDSLRQDYYATLQAVATLGYKNVETIPVDGVTPKQVRAWCDEMGLKVSGTHTGADALLPEKLMETIAGHQEMGCGLLIIPWHDLSTEEKLNGFAALVNRVQPQLEAAGITLAYHNHPAEFSPNQDGQIVYEELLRRTGISMQLDICLAYQAGQDPLAWMDRLGKRLVSIHLKDGTMDGKDCPLGMGTAPVQQAWAKAKKMGVPMVVESETQKPDGLTEARICMDYLRRIEKNLA